MFNLSISTYFIFTKNQQDVNVSTGVYYVKKPSVVRSDMCKDDVVYKKERLVSTLSISDCGREVLGSA